MSILINAEGEKPVVYPVWLLWMDVEGDPLYAHTGLGSISFAPGETGDAALDGNTFDGLGAFAAMGDIQESENGSSPMQLTLPAVDPELPGFKPLIADARRWQFRRSIIWFTYALADGSGLVDYPVREKTGRLDDLRVAQDNKNCTISINIEGFASFSGSPINTRYADQKEIDPTDISMFWTARLSNMQPQIGYGPEPKTGSSSNNSSANASRLRGTNLRASRF